MKNYPTNSPDEFDYENIDLLCEHIKEIVPDERLQNILFSCKHFKSKDLRGKKIVSALNNIILVAFVVTYTRWKQLYNNCENWDESKLSKFRNSRFSKIYKSVYSNEEINLDIAVFALIEIWVNGKVDGILRDTFARLFDEQVDGVGVILQASLDVIKKAGDFFLQDETDAAYKNKLCYELLKAFLIFSEITFDENPDSFSMQYKLSSRKSITLDPNSYHPEAKFICEEKYLCADTVNPTRLYLLCAKTIFADKVQYIYCSLDGKRRIAINADKLPNYTENSQTAVSIEDESENLRKLLSFNYNRLRDCALVIADAVTKSESTKATIFNIYKNKCKTVFPQGLDINNEETNWDNIVTLLLVEIGPSDFIQSIITTDLFNQIMQNIGCRYLGAEAITKLIEKYRIDKMQLSDNFSYNLEMLYSEERKLSTRYIISAMYSSTQEKHETVNYDVYEESLVVKYDKAKSLIRELSNTNNSNAVLTACRSKLDKLLCEVLIFLQVYYDGVDGYADYYRGKDAKVNYKSGLDSFIKSARTRYHKIKDNSLSELYNSFHSLCEEYDDNLFSSDGSKEKAVKLKFAITRSYICDIQRLDYFVDIALPNGEKTNIFHMVENLFSYTHYTEFPSWLSQICDFFMYLVYNDDYNKRGLYKLGNEDNLLDKDFDPIYPYIVSYYQQSIDRDMFKRCNYKVPVPSKDSVGGGPIHNEVVTLLTDTDYELNINYFCTPLKYGSTEHWWINPFMMPTYIFKDILEK